jgi:hypothetical protein
MKEFEIDMVVDVPDTEKADTILDKFLEWVTANGRICGGNGLRLGDVSAIFFRVHGFRR